jgi:hypothetical protein
MKTLLRSAWVALKEFWRGTPRPCPAYPQKPADWYERAWAIADQEPPPGSFLWGVYDALMAQGRRCEQTE